VPHFSDSAPRASASDDFAPPTFEEMRLLWRAYPDPNVRRLLREIAHLRKVLAEVESLRESIDRVWKDEVGGQLAALYHLRIRLQAERVRIGIIQG
jgi:ATP phosphoribosyltransferase regulatory subunit HisZ